ncbi:antitoxin family protein [Pyrodictium delaneyi]|uniref:antitoxin family protein n=1 Tax=Pyrodictium delaneyi TaxID=1273541 RepID=UPI00117A5C91|nr:antitoxin family protein [Pyrodictium delaneyi]
MAKAIYEKGVLRPLQDLGLQEGEEVEIIVRRRPSLRQEDVDRVIEEIDDEGIL